MADGTLKVGTITTSSGSGTITLGQSGETVNVAGTLQNNGAGLVSGITEADMFRLTANLVNPSNGDITSNLERIDDATFSKIGTGMTESSGVFTFPETGLYQVNSKIIVSLSSENAANVFTLVSSDSGSNFDTTGYATSGNRNATACSQSGSSSTFVNVTNTSTFQVKFRTESFSSATLTGDTDHNNTTFTFIRLGDSQ